MVKDTELIIKEHELYKKALNKWGNNTQILMLFEEIAELQKAVCKLTRKDTGSIQDVIEEIVDVEIMLGQLKIMIKVPEVDVIELKFKKLKYLKSLIEDD